MLSAGPVYLLGVTVHNLHDELFGMGSSRRAANQIHGTKTIHAFIFTNNIHVAATPLLQVADRLAATTNDKPNGTIRHHNLGGLFTFAKGGLLLANSFGAARSRVAACFTRWVATILFNYPVDLALCTNSRAGTAGDAALALRASLGPVDELYACLRFLLDATKAFTLPSNYKPNQRGINQNHFRIVVRGWRTRLRGILLLL